MSNFQRIVVSPTLTLHSINRAATSDACFSIREIDIKVRAERPRDTTGGHGHKGRQSR